VKYPTFQPLKAHIKTSHTRDCTGINKPSSSMLNKTRLKWPIFKVNTTVMGTLHNKIIISLTWMMARLECKETSSNSQTPFSLLPKKGNIAPLNQIFRVFTATKTLQIALNSVA